MRVYTPLRYPGGKRRLVDTIAAIIRANGLRDVTYAEPYAGGASIALALLLEEHAGKIHINDLAPEVYAFWFCVLNETDAFCKKIASTRVTMREWGRQRKILRSSNADILDLGFAAFFLNRTNRSGIIKGGVIGGKDQSGRWKLDVRYNKDELTRRIRRISRYRNRIALHRLDALEFTNGIVANLGKNSFTFFDPPYIDKGKDLYLNDYTIEGHRELGRAIQKLKQPWVVTYDYAAITHRLFAKRRRLTYGLRYTAQDRYQGCEVMFFSDKIKLPSVDQLGMRKGYRFEGMSRLQLVS